MDSKIPDLRASRNIPKLKVLVFVESVEQKSCKAERFPKRWSQLKEPWTLPP